MSVILGIVSFCVLFLVFVACEIAYNRGKHAGMREGGWAHRDRIYNLGVAAGRKQEREEQANGKEIV